MHYRYKVILSSRNIYKEIELPHDAQQVKVGTGMDCDIRLRKELFFEPIELVFVHRNTDWSVYCSDNLYLTSRDVRKWITKKLTHGDLLQVKYQNAENAAFDMDFLIDFDDGTKTYERIIDVSNVTRLTIGTAPGSDIVLSGSFVRDDALHLAKGEDGWCVEVQKTTYGVYLNGKKTDVRGWLKDGDFLSISDYFFYFKSGRLWTQIRPDLFVSGLNYRDQPIQNSYPRFSRSTRIKTEICEEKIEILDPPTKPQKPKNNIFLRLLPSFGMLLASGVMAFMGGIMIIMSAISGVMAILTTIMGIREGNKDYKIQVAERIQKYNLYIAKKREEIQHLREQEYQELEELFISQPVEEQRFFTFSHDLFDRSPEDEDYLCVRLGSGDVVSKRAINYKKQEKLEIEDDLQMIPEQICVEYKHVHRAPIVCDLKEIHALGIVGTLNFRFEFLKNMVLDLVARQYFSDVKLFFVASEVHKDHIRWLRFLPHVYNQTVQIRNMVYDDESRNLIFEYLYKELSAREQSKKYENNIVVFFYDEYGFKSHPISRFIDKAMDLGVTFVFFGDTVADIPRGCGRIVSILDAENAALIHTQCKRECSYFTYPSIPTYRAEEIVKLLAPVYTEEISLEGTLTKNISMFELLHILSVDDLNLKERWEQSQVHKSMAAPLGVSKTGVVFLDLHDKAHGPHGLVAGTTGSGKSEILQTYVLSMATLFHPYEVAFVIIDFKGGGMVNQFKDFPHLLGAITNIDGKEISRSLKSIKAELQKRQRLFAELDVNHIDRYIKKFKAGEARVPLPHLVIIVDEFAELKAEQPEFMKELISAARIGRSLGVHLILATQKPSGQVNEQIWSNSRFKLCLKVQSREDSNEVIKSPLAAEIKEPGRAYLQVGNNEIFELFQSAYSGASEKMDDGQVKPFTIYNLTDSGKRVPVYERKKKKSDASHTTQLEAIVKYITEYCKSTHLVKLPDICLPSLGTRLAFPEQLAPAAESGVYQVELGMYDDPDNQYQGIYSIDLAANNLMIIGSAQSGKTNILQSIIRCLSTKYTPDEVNIYIVDFASMVLKNFAGLHHVGGVVCSTEDEKLKNLFKLLRTEVESRKEKLMEMGVSSFTAYKEAGGTSLPLIVLIVDNLTALKELYFQEDDALLSLCREGLTVGISVVIANTQTAGIGYKYLSNFSSKIALFCNDSNEYSTLFDHCAEWIENTAGRSLVEIDKHHYECQIYLAFEGEKEIHRVQAIKSFVLNSNARNPHALAKRIPLIPASLTKAFVLEQFETGDCHPFSVVAGLDYETVLPYRLDFTATGLLAISGSEKSGKHNWVRYSVDMLQTLYPQKTQIYVVDGVGKALGSLKLSENTMRYSVLAEDAISYIREIEQQLKDRYDGLAAGKEEILQEAPLLMLVLDNVDAIVAICNNTEALAAYKNIVGRYRNMRVSMLVFIDNVNIPYSAPEILKNVRDQRSVLFFDDIGNLKIFDLPLLLQRKFKKPVEKGDGYYIKDNVCFKLKTPLCPPKTADSTLK